MSPTINRSMSLCEASSPRATEPNTRATRSRGASSAASDSASASTPPFAAAIATWFAKPCRAATVENRTMPEPAARPLAAALTAIAAPIVFSAKASAMSAAETWDSGLRTIEPTQ